MRFHDLGTLQVEIDGRLISPGGRRAAAVLSALLLNVNHRVSVDVLLEAVWGGDTSRSSVGNLDNHIWRLRRLVEPGRLRGQAASMLINDSGGYRLLATQEQVDSSRFEQLGFSVTDLLATHQPERALDVAAEALAMWRGRPFEDISDRSWAAGPIARLQELHVQLQERRLDAMLAAGQAARAIPELETLLRAHPFRERLWWQRMLALHREGRTPEALEAYQQARAILTDQLGLEPGPDLADLQQRILHQDPSLSMGEGRTNDRTTRPVEIRLPKPVDLIDREIDHDAIAELLDGHWLVTIVGPAGCGKTRLATEVARSSADQFPDGVWFVDLTVANPGDDIAQITASAIGLDIPTTQSPQAALATYGRDRRILLLLDNCEHVIDAVAELCDGFLDTGQQTSILATSREPIALTEEHIYRLGPLAGAAATDQLRGTQQAASPSAVLFCRRARLDWQQLAAADRELIENICHCLDGIPLAIELAAALNPTYNLEEIANQVTEDPAALIAIGRGQANHHQTLRTAINRSYQLLTEEEQLLHRRLSVLPGGFTREPAQAVAETAKSGKVPPLLARLVHRSMLDVTQASFGNARFNQLATTRAHALTELRAHGELDAAEQARDEWTLQLVSARPRTGATEEATWYSQIFSNLDILRATLQRRLITTADQIGPALVPHLCGFWFYHDMAGEGRRWAEYGVQQADRDLSHHHDPCVPMSNRLALASMLLLQGFTDLARNAFDQATTRAPDISPDRIDLAELFIVAGCLFSYGLDVPTMHRAVAAAEPIIERTGDAGLVAGHEAVSCLAAAITDLSDTTLVRAETSYHQAMSADNLWAAWVSCSSINMVALARRDANLGLTWSRHLIHLQEQLGAHSVLHQLETFGDFLALQGQYQQAVRVFSATHHRARAAGTNWPRNPLTNDLIQQAAAHTSTQDFKIAWATGSTMTRAQLTGTASTETK